MFLRQETDLVTILSPGTKQPLDGHGAISQPWYGMIPRPTEHPGVWGPLIQALCFPLEKPKPREGNRLE